MKGALFAIAIYMGTGSVVSEAMLHPSGDNTLAAILAIVAAMYTFKNRIADTELEDAKQALKAARVALASHNALLRAIYEACDANNVEPLKAYLRASFK